MNKENLSSGENRISRRQFLQIAGITMAELSIASGVFRCNFARVSESSSLGDFSDVPTNYPYYDAIMGMKNAGIIDGYVGGKFGPEDPILRQQFAKLIINTLELDLSELNKCPFEDVEKKDENTLYPDNFIAVVAEYQITEGKTETAFDPYSFISRAQLVSMVARSAGYFMRDEIKIPPENYKSQLGVFDKNHSKNFDITEYNELLSKLINYGPTWDPWKPATRGEACQILWNFRSIYLPYAARKIQVKENSQNIEQQDTTIQSINADVVIWGYNGSTAAALHTITNIADHTNPHLKVVHIADTPKNIPQGEECNGVCLSDTFPINRIREYSGFAGDFAKEIEKYYSARGIKPYNSQGRLAYESEIATKIFMDFIEGSKNTTHFYNARLVEALGSGEERYVVIATPDGQIKITTDKFVDTSVEARLARFLGASYRVGKTEKIFNDSLEETTAPLPTSEDDWSTASSSLSQLLTLQLHDVTAPNVLEQNLPYYINGSYDPDKFKSYDPDVFANDWSLTTAALPNNKRELNNYKTDYLDPMASYNWDFGDYESRALILEEVSSKPINFVRYLQENGYPYIGISRVHPWLYIRGGIRVEGLKVYTRQDILNGLLQDQVSRHTYQFDYHDPKLGPTGYFEKCTSYTPMGSLISKELENLAVTCALSSDLWGYNSPERMGDSRMNKGMAVGLMTVVAKELGVNYHDLVYEHVGPRLKVLGSKLDNKII